jgi:CIC family chloride channel protein
VFAPLAGIVLTVETTGRGDLTVARLGASLAAMVVTILLSSQPIYETLKRLMIEHPSTVERSAVPRRSGLEQPR